MTYPSIKIGSRYWRQPVANVASLPTGETVGEIRLVISESTLYQWDGSTWLVMGGSGQATFTNYVYVDQANGNDTSAEKYNPSAPYQTILAAVADAVAGDTIVIRPGTYNESRIQKDQVDYIVEKGAELVTSNIPIWDDRVPGSILRCKIYNYGLISATNGNPGNGTAAIVCGYTPGSRVTVYQGTKEGGGELESAYAFGESDGGTGGVLSVYGGRVKGIICAYGGGRLFVEGTALINSGIGYFFALRRTRTFLKDCTIIKDGPFTNGTVTSNIGYYGESGVSVTGQIFNTEGDFSVFYMTGCDVFVYTTNASHNGTMYMRRTDNSNAVASIKNNRFYDVNCTTSNGNYIIKTTATLTADRELFEYSNNTANGIVDPAQTTVGSNVESDSFIPFEINTGGIYD